MSRWLWIAFVGCGFLTACMHPAQVRFANEYDCPADEVQLEQLGAGTVRAEGCGRTADYLCIVNLYYQGVCSLEREGTPAARLSGSTARQASVSSARPGYARLGRLEVAGEQVPAAQVFVHGAELVIAPEEGRGDFAIVLSLSDRTRPPGSCRRMVWRVDDGERFFLDADSSDPLRPRFSLTESQLESLAEGHEVRATFCGRTSVLPASIQRPLGELLSQEQTRRGRIAESAVTASEAEDVPVEPAAAEADIGAWLDSRGAQILACVGRDAVGLRVSWDEAGETQVSLQHPLSGTPEEECVRGQLTALPDRPGGTAGYLVHVISQP